MVIIVHGWLIAVTTRRSGGSLGELPICLSTSGLLRSTIFKTPLAENLLAPATITALSWLPRTARSVFRLDVVISNDGMVGVEATLLCAIPDAVHGGEF